MTFISRFASLAIAATLAGIPTPVFPQTVIERGTREATFGGYIDSLGGFWDYNIWAGYNYYITDAFALGANASLDSDYAALGGFCKIRPFRVEGREGIALSYLILGLETGVYETAVQVYSPLAAGHAGFSLAFGVFGKRVVSFVISYYYLLDLEMWQWANGWKARWEISTLINRP